jgi:hypothetical protein
MTVSTSRKGFLYRVGVAAAGIGGWTLASGAAPALGNLYCCTSRECSACPTTVGSCPGRKVYSGYTWTCCQNHHVIRCWDCDSPLTGKYACTCTKKTSRSC